MTTVNVFMIDTNRGVVFIPIDRISRVKLFSETEVEVEIGKYFVDVEYNDGTDSVTVNGYVRARSYEDARNVVLFKMQGTEVIDTPINVVSQWESDGKVAKQVSASRTAIPRVPRATDKVYTYELLDKTMSYWPKEESSEKFVFGVGKKYRTSGNDVASILEIVEGAAYPLRGRIDTLAGCKSLSWTGGGQFINTRTSVFDLTHEEVE